MRADITPLEKSADAHHVRRSAVTRAYNASAKNVHEAKMGSVLAGWIEER
jgi:hypothetical protein